MLASPPAPPPSWSESLKLSALTLRELRVALRLLPAFLLSCSASSPAS